MLRTLELFKTSKIIKEYEIIDFKQGKDFYFIKAKATLTNKAELHIREFVSEREYIYSYHWQDVNGRMIIRWDNAPHHRHLKTFPHHKHTPEVEESEEVNLEGVLKVIEGMLRLK